MKTINIPCPKIVDLNDKDVLDLVPLDIYKLLGNADGTGYDLNKDRRDLFFENGVVQYQPNGTKITVNIG